VGRLGYNDNARYRAWFISDRVCLSEECRFPISFWLQLSLPGAVLGFGEGV